MTPQPFNQDNRRNQGHTSRSDSHTTSEQFNLDNYKEKIRNWIRNGINNDEPINFADSFGKYIAKNNLTNSQIRNFFGELRRIQLLGYIDLTTQKSQKTAFLMVKPKLAYAVQRHNNKGLRYFFEFFKIASDAVDKSNDQEGAKHFDNLMRLLEAILAYHRFHGGKE